MRLRTFDFYPKIEAPLIFTLNQFAQLLNPGVNNELILTDLLSRPIIIYIEGIDSQGRKVGATASFSLSSLSDTLELTTILGQ